MRRYSEQTNANCHKLSDSQYGSRRPSANSVQHASNHTCNCDPYYRLVRWFVRYSVQDPPFRPKSLGCKLSFESDSNRYRTFPSYYVPSKAVYNISHILCYDRNCVDRGNRCQLSNSLRHENYCLWSWPTKVLCRNLDSGFQRRSVQRLYDCDICNILRSSAVDYVGVVYFRHSQTLGEKTSWKSNRPKPTPRW